MEKLNTQIQNYLKHIFLKCLITIHYRHKTQLSFNTENHILLTEQNNI